jgi:MFS family permease
VPKWAARLGGRQVVGLGFLISAAGFAVTGLVQESWTYPAFVLPLVAIAVGMGMSNGPASAASTACVPQSQVGEASGVSNMARYVGAAVATAVAATVYSQVPARREAASETPAHALAAGLAATSWVMAAISLVGVLMAVVMGRRARAARGTGADVAAAAAAGFHTLPTSAAATDPASETALEGPAVELPE